MAKRAIVNLLFVGAGVLALGGCPIDSIQNIGSRFTMSYVREHCSLFTDAEIDVIIAAARVGKENGKTRYEVLDDLTQTCNLAGSQYDICYECGAAVANYVWQD